MTGGAEPRDGLYRLLGEELRAARDLMQALEQEHTALTTGGPEDVEDASRRKQRHMERLQLLLRERDRFLLGLDLPPGNRGTVLLVEREPQDSDLVARWRGLQALALGLRERNEINGGIVSLSQQQVRRALDLLTGRGPADSDLTYGRAGGRCRGGRSQPLAKA